jgi:hypothetical protein
VKRADRFGCPDEALELTNARIEVGKLTQLSSAFTVQVWGLWTASTTVSPHLFSNYDGMTNTNGRMSLTHSNADLKIDLIDQAGYPTVLAAGTFSGSTWHQLAVTVTSSRAELFVDGTSRGFTTANNFNVTTAGGLTWRIGDIFDSTRPFGGIVDDIRVYARILSAEEVMGLYQENGWPR